MQYAIIVTDFRVVFVTVPNDAQAEHLTKLVIENRLAACVTQINDVKSTYWWENQIETSGEHLLIMKTRSGLLEALMTTIKKNHSYSVPEIIALPIVEGNPDYLHWISESTTQIKN